jgi:phage tail tape-measure protein
MNGKVCNSILLLSLFFFVGCAQTQEFAKTRTAKGAAIGDAAGTVAGAVIGHHTGAAVGGAIGYKLDQQAKELEKIPNTKVTKEEDRLVVTLIERKQNREGLL